MTYLTKKEALFTVGVFKGIHRYKEATLAINKAGFYNAVTQALATNPPSYICDFSIPEMQAFVAKLEELTDTEATRLLNCIRTYWQSAPHDNIFRAVRDVGLAT